MGGSTQPLAELGDKEASVLLTLSTLPPPRKGAIRGETL